MELGLHILIFVVASLFIGAMARFLLQKTGIPYTVSLLLIGLLLGMLSGDAESLTGIFMLFANTTNQMAEIEPHLILFLFLPALLFESAFATEAHLFKRMLPQIALLAIPGLIIAIMLSATLVQFGLPLDWSWPVALMFGALISATDPVAVVALLKEKSSRKRLETLIEGESLLNDGTAIVFFTLFYAMVLGTASDLSLTSISFEFIRVVAIGFLVGFVTAWVLLFWVSKVFNDVMLETIVTIAGAYLVFIIAEHGFHASGVVAVVTMAIVFASEGRTRFSPEVMHFLHHFWEMLANIFNTLIFLLVGIIIAKQVDMPSTQMWLSLITLYIAAQLIRAFAVTLLSPLLKRLGVGFNKEKAIVLSWGGLRGAVALAMALTVAQQDAIAESVRQQILFFTAGMVVLSIVINGGTISLLLKWLGLNKLPPAKQAAIRKAEQHVDKATAKLSEQLKSDNFICNANWQVIQQRLDKLHIGSAESTENPVDQTDLNLFFKRQLLETERQYYWNQFNLGMQGKNATSILVQAVEQALDGQPILTPRENLIELWNGKPWLGRFSKVPLLRLLVRQSHFENLLDTYGTLRGFIHAQQMLKDQASELAPDANSLSDVQADIDNNLKQADQVLENFVSLHGYMVKELETQIALRLLLNKQREALNQLSKSGVVESSECEKLVSEVEKHMHDLQKHRDLK